MSNPRLTTSIASALAILLLSACGGGGGGSDPVDPADTTPPTVASTYPADGTGGVVVGTPVRVTFNEAMDEATFDTTSFTLAPTSGGILVPGTVSYDSTSNTATFTPDSTLGNSIQYTAAVNTAVTDAAGNALAAAHTWSFTTAADTAVWEPLGGQVSLGGTESEDPTMLITGATPSVGYRHGRTTAAPASTPTSAPWASLPIPRATCTLPSGRVMRSIRT